MYIYGGIFALHMYVTVAFLYTRDRGVISLLSSPHCINPTLGSRQREISNLRTWTPIEELEHFVEVKPMEVEVFFVLTTYVLYIYVHVIDTSVVTNQHSNTNCYLRIDICETL